MPYPQFRSNGSSAKPMTSHTPGHRMDEVWVRSRAASGDARLVYHAMYFSGGANLAGETHRVRALVDAPIATGGTVNAAHYGIDILSGGGISGAGNASRHTLGIAGGVSPGGTLSALQVDSNIGASATPGNAALIRFTKSGSVDIPFIFAVDSTQGCKGSTATSADGLAIRWHDGSTKYIMVGS